MQKMAADGIHERPIQFLSSAENTSGTTYLLPDITDVAEIEHNGKRIKIDKDMLEEIRILGRGHYADNVMLCEVQGHQSIRVAVKKLALVPSTDNPADFTAHTDLRTIRAVGSGENPHVTKFYAALRDREECQLIICMEVCEASMDRFVTQMYLMKRTEHLDLLIRRMVAHIGDALRFLKSKNILHRDVKPSNILLNHDPVLFKLCDFGISGELINSLRGTMMKGTELYLAPERFDRDLAPAGYGVRSDMWALGISIVQIASNQHPFANLETYALIQILKTWTPELPPILSQDLRNLIVQLLQYDYTKRPATYNDILASPTIQSLPKEVTSDEAKLVAEVIENLPDIPDE